MTVVYIDTFLLINFILNFLLLLACGKLAGETIRKWRLALGALMGAVYAALPFFPHFGFLLHPVYKLSAALLMLLITFGNSRKLVRISAIFLALACAFCGGILAIDFLKGGYMKDGVVYSSVDAKGLVISAMFCYGVLALFFKRSAAHTVKGGQLVDVTLQVQERTLTLTALRDSGNTLQDPVSGQQVLIIEAEPLLPLFPEAWALTPELIENPIAAMEHLSKQDGRVRFRLLPYRAVGVDCGMLLAARLDQVTIGEKVYKNHLVALSPTPLTDGGNYKALLGCS